MKRDDRSAVGADLAALRIHVTCDGRLQVVAYCGVAR